MADLSIYLLGTLTATLDGEPVGGFASDKVRALLAYLAAEPDRPHRRETLTGLLWPDYPETAARTSLRRALSNLRTVIGDHRASLPFLTISRQTVQLNCAGDVWCDATALARALAAADSSAGGIAQLEGAIELYRGEFLEGFSLGDSVAFEEWLLLKRERFRREVIAALHRLADYHGGRGDYDRALPYARRQVDLEPWQEQAQRQLMRLLALSGQRGLGVAQYEACERALAKDLGVAPAAETTRLYEQIRAGEVGAVERVEKPLPVGPPHLSPTTIQQTPPGRQCSRAKLLWVGGGLLLLVLVSALVFFAARGWFGSAGTASIAVDSPAAPGEGQVVGPCQGTVPPQICIYGAGSHRRLQVIHGLEFAVIESQSWAPDGQQIIFSASVDPNDPRQSNYDLYVLAVHGSNLRLVADGHDNNVMPAWSPDGEWIAFHRNCALWLVRPDGSEAHLLWEARGKCVMWPAWSPDSQWIAFFVDVLWEAPAPHEVWVIDPQGTASHLLYAVDYPLAEAALAWDPAGQGIALRLMTEYGERTLFVDAEGTSEAWAIDEIPLSWFPNYWPQWGESRGH